MKVSVVVALALLVAAGGAGRPTASAATESITTSATATTGLVAVATHKAVRVNPPPAPHEQTLVFGGGLQARPFAPAGLSDCEEMSFYRQQWGLPAAFDSLGWRESGCRNEDNVRTACCVGYWQLYVSTFVRDYRAAPRLADECAVYGSGDVNSDTPVDKQRQACAAAVVYSIQGFGAWAL